MYNTASSHGQCPQWCKTSLKWTNTQIERKQMPPWLAGSNGVRSHYSQWKIGGGRWRCGFIIFKIRAHFASIAASKAALIHNTTHKKTGYYKGEVVQMTIAKPELIGDTSTNSAARNYWEKHHDVHTGGLGGGWTGSRTTRPPSPPSPSAWSVSIAYVAVATKWTVLKRKRRR